MREIYCLPPALADYSGARGGATEEPTAPRPPKLGLLLFKTVSKPVSCMTD